MNGITVQRVYAKASVSSPEEAHTNFHATRSDLESIPVPSP